MAYLVLAYPDLIKSDFELIENYRREHDELWYAVVKPHVTLVFPVTNFAENEFIKEITSQSKDIRKIEFVIRCATISKDDFKEHYRAFLVPDEGHSAVIKLHDQFYSGQLKDNHRLDLNYVPHITIGNSKDPFHCKRMIDEWNSREFTIRGTISYLTIVKYENDHVTKLSEIKLK